MRCGPLAAGVALATLLVIYMIGGITKEIKERRREKVSAAQRDCELGTRLCPKHFREKYGECDESLQS